MPKDKDEEAAERVLDVLENSGSFLGRVLKLMDGDAKARLLAQVADAIRGKDA
jgi:hypothetical protein